MIKKIVLLSALLLILFSAGIIYLVQKPLQAPAGQDVISLQINQGQTLSALAYSWQQQGWLPSARLLLLQAKLFNSAKHIKPGEYDVPENTNVAAINAVNQRLE